MPKKGKQNEIIKIKLKKEKRNKIKEKMMYKAIEINPNMLVISELTKFLDEEFPLCCSRNKSD